MSQPVAWAVGKPVPQPRRAVVIRTCVRAEDPLVRAGLVSELRAEPGIELRDDPAEADVLVAVPESGLAELLTVTGARLVLVADRPRQAELWTAVQHGLAVLVPRTEATAERLLRAIQDARSGRGDLPPEQLGRLLSGLSRLHEATLAPRGLTLSGLSDREADVLRLLADGLDTNEIARNLRYSERTVKNVLHGLLSRLGLRNRTHAVAHALRHGLI